MGNLLVLGSDLLLYALRVAYTIDCLVNCWEYGVLREVSQMTKKDLMWLAVEYPLPAW